MIPIMCMIQGIVIIVGCASIYGALTRSTVYLFWFAAALFLFVVNKQIIKDLKEKEL